MRTFKIYSLSNCQTCTTVPLTIVAMLYITSPGCIFFNSWKFEMFPTKLLIFWKSETSPPKRRAENWRWGVGNEYWYESGGVREQEMVHEKRREKMRTIKVEWEEKIYDRTWWSHPSLWEWPGTRSASRLWKWLGSASPPFLSTPSGFSATCTYSGSFPTCPSRSGTIRKQGVCLVYLCAPGDIPCWLIYLWHSIHIVNEWMWMNEWMNELKHTTLIMH